MLRRVARITCIFLRFGPPLLEALSARQRDQVCVAMVARSTFIHMHIMIHRAPTWPQQEPHGVDEGCQVVSIIHVLDRSVHVRAHLYF
jgi:hypothetical protein